MLALHGDCKTTENSRTKKAIGLYKTCEPWNYRANQKIDNQLSLTINQVDCWIDQFEHAEQEMLTARWGKKGAFCLKSVAWEIQGSFSFQIPGRVWCQESRLRYQEGVESVLQCSGKLLNLGVYGSATFQPLAF